MVTSMIHHFLSEYFSGFVSLNAVGGFICLITLIYF